jgi:hypothetical protein
LFEGEGVLIRGQVANTAGDALMTELAKQEPEAKKGTLQSQYYMVRSISMGLVAALLSFGFNSPTYGGTFGWAFTVPQYLLILLGLVVVCLCVASFPPHHRFDCSHCSIFYRSCVLGQTDLQSCLN